MYWLRRLLLWLPGRRRSRARELEEELRANLSLALEDAAESGLPPAQAARAARRDFGSLTGAHEEARGVWLPGWDTLSQDLRFAVRTLARTPAFTLVAVLSLALGTGAATALFSLVDTVALKPLAYRQPGRLVFIREVVPALAHIYPTLPVNMQHFRFWREQARSFTSLAAVGSNSASATLLSGGEPEAIGLAEVTANLFDLLGVQPQFGRLGPSVTLTQSTMELNLFEKRIAAEHKLDGDLRVEARPLQDVIGSPVRTSLAVLLSAVLMLVLIVCVNLANLLLARGSARTREFAMRIALGASRSRLLVSALVESLLLAGAGGTLGVVAARAALVAFVRTAPVDLPRIDEVHMDGRVLAFALALSLFCGVLFGLLPALRLSHTDPQAALRGESHAITGSRTGLQLREWLVGGQVALSTLLLVLAGLLVSSLWHVLRVDRGFSDDRALDIDLSLPSRYRTVQQRAAFFDLAADRLRALPGVRSVAVASRVPLTGESNVNSVELEGTDGGVVDPTTRQLVMVNVRFIGPDFFEALGIPLLRGRTIEPTDRERAVAVISARLAAKLWPGQNPLGKVLKTGSGVKHAEVVGVVQDVHSTRLERDPTLMIYVPFWKQAYQVSHLVVRSSNDPRILSGDVRRTLRAIDSGIPAPKMRTMGEIVAESVAQRRFQMRMAAAFALSALLLAALGIYGVVAYAIHLRRREFGIRMALGARTAEVCLLAIWQGLRPVTLGLGAGIAGALLAGRLVRSLLFGINATDGLTLGIVAAGLACVATMACLLPAHSVAGIDPSRVLRDE